MSCDEIRIRLDDHADGALPEAEQIEVERHLRDCPRCRDDERSLRSLLAAAAALPREASPSRDLWPGIAERIGRQGRTWTSLVLAAAAVVVIGLGAALLRRETPLPPEVSAIPAAAGTESLDLKTAEGDYERATAALLAALEARRDSLSPETLASVERNLAVIDGAMAEVREALRREPGRPELTRMLVATHRKKVDVLRRVVKLSSI